MPGYPFLAKAELKIPDISADLTVNRMVGVPYTDEQIANAQADMMAQANPDDDNVDALEERYPGVVIRDYDGNPDKVTEMDAMVAYLQMLGTLVDFSIYDDKADLR
jgi:cytochrome c oxidase cbb3-type subunit 2